MKRFFPVLFLLFLVGCSAAGPIASMLTQIACNITPILDPASKQTVASVCAEIAPDVQPVVSAVASLAGSGDTKPCRLVPVTPDGVTGMGVACDFACGDMASASSADPCPAIDAKLRTSPGAKTLADRRGK